MIKVFVLLMLLAGSAWGESHYKAIWGEHNIFFNDLDYRLYMLVNATYYQVRDFDAGAVSEVGRGGVGTLEKRIEALEKHNYDIAIDTQALYLQSYFEMVSKKVVENMADRKIKQEIKDEFIRKSIGYALQCKRGEITFEELISLIGSELDLIKMKSLRRK